MYIGKTEGVENIMWEKRSTYGDEECSLRDSFITAAGIEDGVFYMEFEEGFVLTPGTWANPFKNKAYRSEEALVAIQLDEELDEQDAVEVLIRGMTYSFGKPLGMYEKYIPVDELLDDIKGHPDRYKIKSVYSSEGEAQMLLRGSIHTEWKNAAPFRQELDHEFEITVYQKMGAKMRYFWNELDLKKPIEE